jgi:Zn-dependent metalloprotease
MRPDLADLQLLEERESQGAHHVRFQQTFRGIPVFGATVTVNVSNVDGGVHGLLNRYVRDLQSARLTVVVDQAAAVRAAERAIGVAGPARGKAEAHLVYFPASQGYVLSWRVTYAALDPLGTWQVIVQADSHKVLSKHNLLRFDGGRVFDPNPVVTSGGTIPPPSDCDTGANESSLSAQYQTETLLGIQSGQDKLKGAYVDLTAPGLGAGYKPAGQAEEPSRNYIYPCTDDRFEEVMVYYHVDAAQRFIQSLGFAGVNSVIARPIAAHAHYFASCNAFYDPFDLGLHFGDSVGCGTFKADAAEDADVILHEYGHAIHDDQVPGWGGGPFPLGEESLSMGEGFGDFLPSVVFGGDCEGEWFSFNNNACAGSRGLRWLNNSKVYPADFEACPNVDNNGDTVAESEEEHCGGQVWSAALWDLAEALGNDPPARQLALRLVLNSHFYLDPTSTFAEAAAAIRQADIDILAGAHVSIINSVFTARGITPAPSVDDFPFSYIRILHTDAARDLDIQINVGSQTSPLCTINIWDPVNISATALAGYDNMSACASFSPPTVAQPWYLKIEDVDPDGNTGTLTHYAIGPVGPKLCLADNTPLSIVDGGTVYGTVTCTNFVQAQFCDANDLDCDGIPNDTDPDDDNDGIADVSDNCPVVYNPMQTNTDRQLEIEGLIPIVGDDIGDACDSDDDNDALSDGSDPNPLHPDPDLDSCIPTTYAICLGPNNGGSFSDRVELSVGTNPNDRCADTTVANDEADDKWPPDFNDDRSNNTLDFALWKNSFASPPKPLNPRADLNADTSVNTLDFAVWKPYFYQAAVCQP